MVISYIPKQLVKIKNTLKLFIKIKYLTAISKERYKAIPTYYKFITVPKILLDTRNDNYLPRDLKGLDNGLYIGVNFQ